MGTSYKIIAFSNLVGGGGSAPTTATQVYENRILSFWLWPPFPVWPPQGVLLPCSAQRRILISSHLLSQPLALSFRCCGTVITSSMFLLLLSEPPLGVNYSWNCGVPLPWKFLIRKAVPHKYFNYIPKPRSFAPFLSLFTFFLFLPFLPRQMGTCSSFFSLPNHRASNHIPRCTHNLSNLFVCVCTYNVFVVCFEVCVCVCVCLVLI